MTEETRKERFKRVAEARTNKIIKMVRLLANCSNKSAYEYEEEEVRKIFATLDAELKAAKSKFGGKRDERFRFD